MNKEKIKNETKQKVDELFNTVEKWENKAEQVSDQVTKKVNSRIKDLKKEKEGLEAKYHQIETATQDNWEEAKTSLSQAVKSFENGVSELSAIVTG